MSALSGRELWRLREFEIRYVERRYAARSDREKSGETRQRKET